MRSLEEITRSVKQSSRVRFEELSVQIRKERERLSKIPVTSFETTFKLSVYVRKDGILNRCLRCGHKGVERTEMCPNGKEHHKYIIMPDGWKKIE